MERIQVSIKDLSRLDILTKIKEGHFKQSKGAEILGISPRQIRRLVQRLKLEGPQSAHNPEMHCALASLGGEREVFQAKREVSIRRKMEPSKVIGFEDVMTYW